MSTLAQLNTGDFTGTLEDIEAAVLMGIGEAIGHAIVISGMFLAGIILYRVFRKVAAGDDFGAKGAGGKSSGGWGESPLDAHESAERNRKRKEWQDADYDADNPW